MPDDNPLLTLPWDRYSKPPIFENLDNIASFSAMAQFPQFIPSGDDKLREQLIDRLYQEVFAVITEIGLGAQDRIERFSRESTTGGSDVGVQYKEDTWEFTLYVTDNQQLILARGGSSFRRFYDWYLVFMPYYKRLVEALQEEYEQIIHERNGSELRVTPSRASFVFRFLLHDFTTLNRRTKVKNTMLLRSALTRVPGSDGSLVDLSDDVLPELGRVDLKISRWNETVAGLVREVYELQAPANREYGALWAEFSYLAETSDSDAPPRTVTDMGQFISRVDLPLNDFLQMHCLNNFLGTLSEGVSFHSSAGSLP